MLQKLRQSVRFLETNTGFKPDAGIILGSGLGGLVKELKTEHVFGYETIPNFPVSTVEGHQSRMYFGTLGNVPVAVMQGRFHYYEGYSMQEVTFGVRVMHMMGIKKLILSNASGGVNKDFKVGDLMIIKDHINLMGGNPLIGKNIEELGPRFPDMSEPYDLKMIDKAYAKAKELGYRCHIGVYASVTGPCFETPAEYKYIRVIGADAVGMSTVPEVIIARHMNLRCFAVSVITDLGGHDHLEKVSHDDVIKAATSAEPKMTEIVKAVLQ